MNLSGEIGIPVAVNRSGGHPMVMWDLLRAVDQGVSRRCLDGAVSGATSLAVLADNEDDFSDKRAAGNGRVWLPAGFSDAELALWHRKVREDGRWLF